MVAAGVLLLELVRGRYAKWPGLDFDRRPVVNQWRMTPFQRTSRRRRKGPQPAA